MVAGEAHDGRPQGSGRREGRVTAQDAQESRSEDNDRGDGEEVPGLRPSLSERLRASGRMAWNAMTSDDAAIAATLSDQKPASTSGSSAHRLPQAIGEASSASSSQRTAQAELGPSIRRRPPSEDATAAFDSFIEGPNGGVSEPEPALQGYQGPRSPPTTKTDATPPSDQNWAIAQQEAADGTDVVQLLSMPSFEADATLWTEENDDALSSIEAARLRGALFAGDLGDTRSHWDRLLNFRPEGVDNPVDMQQLLGTTESSAVDSIWLQQWSDVLTAYTDEVWGDLGPLAAEAKHEVDRLSSRNAQTQDNGGTMALNRLRQILAHVRGHA